MNIEGLHNQTGKWVVLCEVYDDEESTTTAIGEMREVGKGCNSVIEIWNTQVRVEHFSAFRANYG